jgi:hypothetical protein
VGCGLGAASLGLTGLAAAASHSNAVTLATTRLEQAGYTPLPGRNGLLVPFELDGHAGHNVIGHLPASEVGGGANDGRAILIGTPCGDRDPAAVTATLRAAESLAATSLRHPLVVACWSTGGDGREGSRAFLEQTIWLAERLLAYLHLERVQRSAENRLFVLGAGSSPAWRGLVERANVPVGFDIRIEDDPKLPMDSFTFHEAGVPAISLSGAGPEEPRAATAPANPSLPPPQELTERVARLAALLARRLDRLDEPPRFVTYESTPRKPTLAKQSAYTGTIPDYTAEVDGLLLSGVVEGGPAAAAGLAAGDVIVEFAGREISDIYDYRDALEAVAVDRPIPVIFLRDGERREVTVVPTARP